MSGRAEWVVVGVLGDNFLSEIVDGWDRSLTVVISDVHQKIHVHKFDEIPISYKDFARFATLDFTYMTSETNRKCKRRRGKRAV